MFGRRNVTKDIFRAVVLGGAMLTMTAGCSSDAKPTKTPGTMEKPAPTTTPPAAVADAGMPATNPCEGKKNPCEARTADAGAPDAGRRIPRGRGFILA